ncbi:hypothetical protein [Streptomyces sp. x-80]|uniref:hypothetical protein n=1 Tax=Streptomyces sp. x-80 TaxID=2789282 RepID=UPI00397FDA94
MITCWGCGDEDGPFVHVGRTWFCEPCQARSLAILQELKDRAVNGRQNVGGHE